MERMNRLIIIILLIAITCLVNYFYTITEGQENMDEDKEETDTKEEDALEYDPANLDIDYIKEDEMAEEPQDNVAWVKDKDGNMVELEQGDQNEAANKLSDNIKYYEPGTYKYGSSSYVPTYQDSIYLSKTTGQSTVTEVIDNDAISKGICSHYKDYPEKMETECNKLNKNICASTNCCVLFGGSKCVAGNARGPTSKLNYGDVTIRNRDYYYYKGKCYGNCVSQPNVTGADVDIPSTEEPVDATEIEPVVDATLTDKINNTTAIEPVADATLTDKTNDTTSAA